MISSMRLFNTVNTIPMQNRFVAKHSTFAKDNRIQAFAQKGVTFGTGGNALGGGVFALAGLVLVISLMLQSLFSPFEKKANPATSSSPENAKTITTEPQKYLDQVAKLQKDGNDEEKLFFLKALFSNPEHQTFIASMNDEAIQSFAKLAVSIQEPLRRKDALVQLIIAPQQPQAAKVLGEALKNLPDTDPAKLLILEQLNKHPV